MAKVMRGRGAAPAQAKAPSAPVGIKAATEPVTDATAFEPDAFYLVRLSKQAEYLGTPLAPMHLHTVKGVVAQAIRDKILAFAPA